MQQRSWYERKACRQYFKHGIPIGRADFLTAGLRELGGARIVTYMGSDTLDANLRAIYHGIHGIRGNKKGAEFFLCVPRFPRVPWLMVLKFAVAGCALHLCHPLWLVTGAHPENA